MNETELSVNPQLKIKTTVRIFLIKLMPLPIFGAIFPSFTLELEFHYSFTSRSQFRDWELFSV